MKVLLINGSPNPKGNTAIALDQTEAVFTEKGFSTERLEVGGELIQGCVGCFGCFKARTGKCVKFPKDQVNDWIDKLAEADGIVLGSPVYYAGINGTFKSFLDRAFFAALAGGNPLRHKVGLAVAAVRRAGSMPTLDQLNRYFSIMEMAIASGNYWLQVHGMTPGEANEDPEGLQSVRVGAENMAWLLRIMEHGRDAIPAPAQSKKIFTNFIRPLN